MSHAPGALKNRDELYEAAVDIVVREGRGSVSLLQRRLTIGYSRASRLIEQMSEAGIIGEYKGSQAREVQMTVEEWDALRAQAAADAQDDSGGEYDGGDDDESVPDELDGEYRQ